MLLGLGLNEGLGRTGLVVEVGLVGEHAKVTSAQQSLDKV
jgi:hypothetical protein